MVQTKMKKILSDVFSLMLLFLSFTILFALIKTNLLWGDVYFEQILLNLSHGLINIGKNIVWDYLLWTVLPAAILCIVCALLINKNRWLIVISFLCLIYPVYKVQLIPFLIYQNTPTSLYEDEYANPAEIDFQFPENKRNLIVLYMESMEKDYANPKLAGENLLPNLSRLAAENISFDGYHQLQNQDYTIAGMLTSLCSVPFRLIKNKNYTTYNNFMPGLVCYPEILKKNGYKTYFMKGATLDFTRTGMFFNNHGFDDVKGHDELKKRYGLEHQKYQGTSWGLNDRTLYELAKQRLKKISRQPEPFLFSMLTLDTHGPDIYLDKQCAKLYNDSRDVIMCADKMMGAFVEWIKQQDFYENTTIVILGDHIKTGKNDLYPQHKNREIVNIILNPVISKPKEIKRSWTLFDMAPTILQAIGIDFPNGKFGLGQSLFLPEATLQEKLKRNLDIELMKSSKVYDAFNTIETTFEPLYNPYPQWGVLINNAEQIRSYASFSDNIFNLVWVDTFSFTLPKLEKDDFTFDVWFKILFMKNKQRTIEIFANNHLIDTWNLTDQVKQPIHKKLTIPSKIIGDERKLLLEFRLQDAGYTAIGIGLGIQKFVLQ